MDYNSGHQNVTYPTQMSAQSGGMVYAMPASNSMIGSDDKNTVYIGSNVQQGNSQMSPQRTYVVQGSSSQQMNQNPMMVMGGQPQGYGQHQSDPTVYQGQSQNLYSGQPQQIQYQAGDQLYSMMQGNKPNMMRTQVSNQPQEVQQVSSNMGNLRIIGSQQPQIMSQSPNFNQGPESQIVRPQDYDSQNQQIYSPQNVQSPQGGQVIRVNSPQRPIQQVPNQPQAYNPNQQRPMQQAPSSPQVYNPSQPLQQAPNSPQVYNPSQPRPAQKAPSSPQVYNPNQPQAYNPNQQRPMQQAPSSPQVYNPNQTQAYNPMLQQAPQTYNAGNPQAPNLNQQRPMQQAPSSPQVYNPNQSQGPMNIQNNGPVPNQSNAPKSFVIQPNSQLPGSDGPNPRPPPIPNQPSPMARNVNSSDQGNKPMKIREMPGSRRDSMAFDDQVDFNEPPQVVSHPKPQINLNEGDDCSVTAKIKPAGDSSLQVEWYKNGKSLPASSRYNCTFDRGYAVLQFLYTNDDDSGEYYCIAKNKLGQQQSSSCNIKVVSGSGVITETQLPEDSMIANLEAMEEYLDHSGHFNRYEDEKNDQAPTFVKNLQPIKPMAENSPAHFECIVEPSTDSNLSVDWYKDEKPVTMGCRFNATLDRGFAIFDILYCYSEDSGNYYCIAKNKNGEVKSNVIPFICTGEDGIITKSALSKDSIAYLESLDNFNSDVGISIFERPAPEDSEELSEPKFVIQPIPVTACEGTPARFLVKADGCPRPKVMWYINGDLIASSGAGGNWRIYQDGGISYLEFHRCSHPGTYEITIVASNSQGEARTTTTFVVENQPDFRPGLKHVVPENPFKKMMQLRRVDCTDELVNKMRKPKPQATDLRKIERFSEHKGRYNKETEQAEVENLYSKVQQNLRTGRASVPPQMVENRPVPPKEPEILSNQASNKSQLQDNSPANQSIKQEPLNKQGPVQNQGQAQQKNPISQPVQNPVQNQIQPQQTTMVNQQVSTQNQTEMQDNLIHDQSQTIIDQAIHQNNPILNEALPQQMVPQETVESFEICEPIDDNNQIINQNPDQTQYEL